ncbi:MULTISPECIES: hypothetical protein [Streptomyces]|uniref:hypothetical protein n=1 Tax=Streptomyces TaxID=1883 RepID=UPI00073E0ABE|nr:hypothetical protein [Streptomyces sp. EAS-AB2608]MYU27059.1 hypothetical protein [Streptomyces sp. SID7810]BCM65164.1 hypothetical protein EASAB2608_00498 [Streptomyces sp. EAS-AB2608]CUW25896.1 hypothetical protein TUE45_00606 [Streptomyces reticuli]
MEPRPALQGSTTQDAARVPESRAATAADGPLGGGASDTPPRTGISTRLATTAGRPVRVTFRARANTLAGDCGLRRTRHPGKDFRCQAEGHPLATVTVTDDWRTWTHDFTPTGPDTELRFTPGPRAGCGPLLTDVVAREAGS